MKKGLVAIVKKITFYGKRLQKGCQIFSSYQFEGIE